jgi:hypothetical protein
VGGSGKDRSECEGGALLRRKRAASLGGCRGETRPRAREPRNAGSSSTLFALALLARRTCSDAAEAGCFAPSLRSLASLGRPPARKTLRTRPPELASATKECPSTAEAGRFARGLSGGGPPNPPLRPARSHWCRRGSCGARGPQSSLGLCGARGWLAARLMWRTGPASCSVYVAHGAG